MCREFLGAQKYEDLTYLTFLNGPQILGVKLLQFHTRLVEQYIGQTEENMKTVLEEAKGNVLFIDETYTLFTGSDDHKNFGRRVLDSLLTVLSLPDSDILIVFTGYTKEMDVVLNTNPRLSGRFPYRYYF